MKLSDVITIRKATQKPRYTYAEIRGFEGRGIDSDTAIRDLIEIIDRASRNNRRTYRFTADGTVFCLYWAFDSWCYDIAKPGRVVPSSCHTSAKTYSEALVQMERHVAQYND